LTARFSSNECSSVSMTFENFTVRACGDWGSRCEASATVCAEQGGFGQCLVCEDDLCNHASGLFSLLVLVATFGILF
uniref:Egg protein CP422 n=1 Tax=Haemonchus placei TaxID=6290 RepID=A0A0N4WVE6_HAEPC